MILNDNPSDNTPVVHYKNAVYNQQQHQQEESFSRKNIHLRDRSVFISRG